MPDWKDALPEEHRGAAALKDIKDLGALAKSYLEAQSMLGNSVRLPSKEAGEEGRKAFRLRVLEAGKDHGITALPGEGEDDAPFFKVLGTPDKPEEYPLPDGVKAENEVATLLKLAHGAKLTKKQFSALYKGLDDQKKSLELVQEGVRTADQATLKEKWGEALETKRSELQELLKEHGAPADLLDAYTKGRVNAASMLWLHDKLTGLGGEAKDLSSQQRTGGKLTPGEAYARVEEVEARLKKLDQGDPEYDALVKRRVDLLEQASPA